MNRLTEKLRPMLLEGQSCQGQTADSLRKGGRTFYSECRGMANSKGWKGNAAPKEAVRLLVFPQQIFSMESHIEQRNEARDGTQNVTSGS